MIPKVTKGRRLRGLLEYLWGPGRHDEHTNPHIVAGYDDPAQLTPPRHPTDVTRWDLTGLAGRLDAPHLALGDRGLDEYVLQVSLSLPVDDRAVSEQEWQQIAERFVARMGLADDGQRAGCRWIAVHHGRSIKGNDHIHIVVTRATEDGAPVWLRSEWRAAQRICDELETEFSLAKRTPAREGATARPATSRAEIERARRSGRAVADREVLRREVHAALAAATSETDWVAGMKAAGLLVAARAAGDDPDRVVGYAVALHPAVPGKAPHWVGGGRLDGELSLPRVRQRWPQQPSLSVSQWQAVIPPEVRALAGAQRIAVWRATATALETITGQMAAVPSDSPQWPAITRATADTMAQLAAVAEPSGSGPLSQAVDILARAAAPQRSEPPPPASALATDLGRVAEALLTAGRARSTQEAMVLMSIVVQAARLIVALAELRSAQQRLHAVGAAQTAAARLMPLLEQARQAGTPVTGGRPPAQRDSVPPGGRAAVDRGDGPPEQDRRAQR